MREWRPINYKNRKLHMGAADTVKVIRGTTFCLSSRDDASKLIAREEIVDTLDMLTIEV